MDYRCVSVLYYLRSRTEWSLRAPLLRYTEMVLMTTEWNQEVWRRLTGSCSPAGPHLLPLVWLEAGLLMPLFMQHGTYIDGEWLEGSRLDIYIWKRVNDLLLTIWLSKCPPRPFLCLYRKKVYTVRHLTLTRDYLKNKRNTLNIRLYI